jgi:hypothetical protein
MSGGTKLTFDSVEVRPYALMGAVLATFVVLLMLDLALRREWVKRNLPRSCARWVSIRWAPLAPGWAVYWRPGFRVIYFDGDGRRHKAYCRPWDIKWRSPLAWVRDEITDEHNSATRR